MSKLRNGGSEAWETSVAGAFRQHDAPVMSMRILERSTISVAEVRSEQRNFGMSAPIPYADAYNVGLQLRACHDHDLYFDRRRVQPTNFGAGTLSFYDLRRNPIADVRDPFHSVHFHLPIAALREVGVEMAAPKYVDLRVKGGVGLVDPVAQRLLMSFLPCLARPAEANLLFVEHVALALTAHVAQVYGGVQMTLNAPRPGLAPWQLRRAKEAIWARLDGDISLDDLARDCGLSRSYFNRAFRQSTGLSPYRWLTERRIDAAKELLRDASRPLALIAIDCGFADQSHFTRVFSRVTGLTPGAWQRLHRS